ncbi:MAG: ABC transporter [Ruminiclostridium sp.]|nr:ABC transporter [Ruminiclostridium sp.]
MNFSNAYAYPSLYKRITSIWYRHFRVYISNFFSNAFPPFLEPIIFLAGMGIGIGAYIQNMGSMSYVLFLASGLIVTSSMYTASFECTFGTFIRLEFDKIYDGMLGAPISPGNLIIGELLFVGTKGFFFSFAVLFVIWIMGIINYPLSILSVFVGFLTGVMFGVLSMLITSFVKIINHFNFYFTGLLTPMFFFSGVVFPIENLPKALAFIAEIVPLTHVVRLARAFCVPGSFQAGLLLDLLYCVVFTIVVGWFAVKGLKNRMVT